MIRRILQLLLALGLVAGSAQSGLADHLEFLGYGRESGAPGEPNPGDSLWLAGLVTDAVLESDLPFTPASQEYTVVLRDCVYWGAEQSSHGTLHHYQGGRLEIHADPAMDATWLAAPAGPDPPASFTNGELWLSAFVPDLIRYGPDSRLFCMFEPDGGLAQPWFTGFTSLGADFSSTAGEYAEAGYTFRCYEGQLGYYSWLVELSSLSSIKALY